MGNYICMSRQAKLGSPSWKARITASSFWICTWCCGTFSITEPSTFPPVSSTLWETLLVRRPLVHSRYTLPYPVHPHRHNSFVMWILRDRRRPFTGVSHSLNCAPTNNMQINSYVCSVIALPSLTGTGTAGLGLVCVWINKYWVRITMEKVYKLIH